MTHPSISPEDVAALARWVYNHIASHVTGRNAGQPTPGLNWQPWALSNWCKLELPTVDLVSGWTTPIIDVNAEPGPDSEPPLVVRFCPTVIANTIMHLPMSPKPKGTRPYINPNPPEPDDDDDTEGFVDEMRAINAIWYADNYVRFVEHILDVELMLWDQHPDPGDRRRAAEASLWDAHPAGLTLMSTVQLDALARAISPGATP